MTEKSEIFKCNVCNNVIEIIHEGFGELVCCNQPMEKMKENIPDESNAHFAHIEKINDVERKIFFNHVMNGEHHLELIEVISNDGKYIKRKYLEETQSPEMILKCDCKEGFYVRLYCNLDGVWSTKNAMGEN